MNDVRRLGSAGKRLRKAILNDLPDGWELDAREAELLYLAARQADEVGALDALIRKHGRLVTGSQGQPVLNPAVAEARQARALIDRLLGRIALPSEDGMPRIGASQRAKAAAEVRWTGEKGRTRGAA